MKTTTLFPSRDLTESELAAALEEQFGAAWFVDRHRCSIDTDDAFVAVDFDSGYLGLLSPEDQHALVGQLGFLPKAALHVSASVYHSGSPALAERVALALGRLFGGRALAAA